jgi:hypothetical protein
MVVSIKATVTVAPVDPLTPGERLTNIECTKPAVAGDEPETEGTLPDEPTDGADIALPEKVGAVQYCPVPTLGLMVVDGQLAGVESD